jgi:hypothetical protein
MVKDSVVIKLKPFKMTDVKNRDLILKMLKYEDSIITSEVGQSIYRNKVNEALFSIEPQLIIQRMTLKHFGFDTDDDSGSNYREIFRNYYKSPTNYDKEVLQSVTYMRANRCVYYTQPIIKVGDKIPNVELYDLDGKTKLDLHKDILKEGDFNYAFMCAFSTS